MARCESHEFVRMLLSKLIALPFLLLTSLPDASLHSKPFDRLCPEVLKFSFLFLHMKVGITSSGNCFYEHLPSCSALGLSWHLDSIEQGKATQKKEGTQVIALTNSNSRLPIFSRPGTVHAPPLPLQTAHVTNCTATPQSPTPKHLMLKPTLKMENRVCHINSLELISRT